MAVRPKKHRDMGCEYHYIVYTIPVVILNIKINQVEEQIATNRRGRGNMS